MTRFHDNCIKLIKFIRSKKILIICDVTISSHFTIYVRIINICGIYFLNLKKHFFYKPLNRLFPNIIFHFPYFMISKTYFNFGSFFWNGFIFANISLLLEILATFWNFLKVFSILFCYF